MGEHRAQGQSSKKEQLVYTVIIEKGETGYGAWAPDVPGCIAVGTTVEQTTERFREALEDYFAALKAEGRRIPVPASVAVMVEAGN